MSNATVSDQLQSMWRTRPYRLPQRGHIAGVAAGIGHRYGVDPVLIRVAFVVGTIFGGSGIVLYLAAWLTLNKAGDDASAAGALVGKGNSSDSTTKIVVLVVALIIAVTTLGPVGIGLGGSGVISMVALLAGLWLLHQRSPEPPDYVPGVGQGGYPLSNFPISFNTPYTAPSMWTGAQYRPPQYRQAAEAASTQYTPYTTLPKSYVPETPAPQHDSNQQDSNQQDSAQHDSPQQDKTGSAATGVDLTKAQAETGGLPPQPTPPSWDPLGVAPFAWDLPEPAADRSLSRTPRRKRSRWTSSFIGLALLAAAVTGAVAAGTGSDWLTPARIAAVALAVVGTGLLLGAFLRKGYGLLIVTAPLLGFVILASIVGPVDFDGASSGSIERRPVDAAALEPSYAIAGGDLQLDLTALTLTSNETVDIDVTGGNATITIPSTLNVDPHCSAVMGSVDCGSGGLIRGSDAAPDAPILTINGDVRFGNLEIIHE